MRVHGREALEAAQRATLALFGGSLDGLDAKTLEDVFSEVPSVEIERSRLDQGIPVLDLLIETGVVPSKKEARRRIEQGGIYLNNKPLPDPQKRLTPDDLLAENVLVLRSGKKNYFLVRFG
jgi:tyrosyl-tRNA synthetase